MAIGALLAWQVCEMGVATAHGLAGSTSVFYPRFRVHAVSFTVFALVAAVNAIALMCPALIARRRGPALTLICVDAVAVMLLIWYAFFMAGGFPSRQADQRLVLIARALFCTASGAFTVVYVRSLPDPEPGPCSRSRTLLNVASIWHFAFALLCVLSTAAANGGGSLVAAIGLLAFGAGTVGRWTAHVLEDPMDSPARVTLLIANLLTTLFAAGVAVMALVEFGAHSVPGAIVCGVFSLPLGVPVVAHGLAYWHLMRPEHPPGCCRGCGYDLAGITSTTCPECGRADAAAIGANERVVG